MENGVSELHANKAEDITIASHPNSSSSRTMTRSAAQSWGTIYKGLVLSAKADVGVKLEELCSLEGTSQVVMKQINDRHGVTLAPDRGRRCSTLMLGIMGKRANTSVEGELLDAESGTAIPLANKMGSVWDANASKEVKVLRRAKES
jgi:hypothetical protein